MTETELMKRIQLEVSKHGGRVFRNNVGRLPDGHGGWLQYGLGVGTSDLIGWWHGRFLAIEVKTQKGVITDAQQHFIDEVKKAGGIGIIAGSIDNINCIY